jgi:hypothetical protein
MSVPEFVPLPEASPLFPSRPHVATLYRWVREGVQGKKLETTRCGGKRYVTPEQARRFLTQDGQEAKSAS